MKLKKHKCTNAWVHQYSPTYRSTRAVVRLLKDVIQNQVFHKDCYGLQDEGHKQVHVDVVSRAVQFPVGKQGIQLSTHTDTLNL